MSLFTSDREQRLWLLVLAVIVAIYATLGSAGTLAAFLRENNLLRITIVVVLVLAVGAITWQWVKRRPSRGEIGVALAVATVYLMVVGQDTYS